MLHNLSPFRGPGGSHKGLLGWLKGTHMVFIVIVVSSTVIGILFHILIKWVFITVYSIFAFLLIFGLVSLCIDVYGIMQRNEEAFKDLSPEELLCKIYEQWSIGCTTSVPWLYTYWKNLSSYLTVKLRDWLNRRGQDPQL